MAGTLLPGFGVPDWAFRFIVIVLVLGFGPVLIFSWAFEITPEGVKREKDVVHDTATQPKPDRQKPSVTNSQNHVAALHLAAVYARAGEVERLERLVDMLLQEVDAFQPRHHEDEAVIHALRGDDQAAIDALGSIDPGMKTRFWREFVVRHPAFGNLLQDPRFQALNAEFEAQMARQLARVRQLEASGELRPEVGS